MMKYQQLVVNGCSYMESYASGFGHQELAERLSIPQAISLAIGGSANSRIIRTTLKHSYITLQPTLFCKPAVILKVDGLIFKIKAGVRDGMLPGHKQILMQ